MKTIESLNDRECEHKNITPRGSIYKQSIIEHVAVYERVNVNKVLLNIWRFFGDFMHLK